MSTVEMNALNENDTELTYSLKHWGAKQNPPTYIRARLLRKAGSHQKDLGKTLLMKLRGLNLYWTGRPLSNAELAKWLFSRAMLDCLTIDRHALRVVC